MRSLEHQFVLDDLDLERLGATLVNVLLASLKARHRTVKGTLQDYLTSFTSPEVAFIRDLVFGRTEDTVRRWIGDPDEVGAELARITD